MPSNSSNLSALNCLIYSYINVVACCLLQQATIANRVIVSGLGVDGGVLVSGPAGRFALAAAEEAGESRCEAYGLSCPWVDEGQSLRMESESAERVGFGSIFLVACNRVADPL